MKMRIVLTSFTRLCRMCLVRTLRASRISMSSLKNSLINKELVSGFGFRLRFGAFSQTGLVFYVTLIVYLLIVRKILCIFCLTIFDCYI